MSFYIENWRRGRVAWTTWSKVEEVMLEVVEVRGEENGRGAG